jgi:GNAT superfamily N-acetyltransferase
VVERRPAPAGLVIERVAGVEGLPRWLCLVQICFGLQDATASAWFDLFVSQGFGPDLLWQLFVRLAAGQPVSASRLFFAEGVAGIYHVATLPEARGQAFGTALEPNAASHNRANWAVVEARMASGRSAVRVRGMDLSRGLRR